MLIIDKLKLADRFTETEKEIATYLISLGNEMKGVTTRGVAEKTYSSPATVVRLCKKLDYKGFDDFKAEYMKELEYINRQYGDVNANFPFEKTDPMMNVMNKIAKLHMDTIEDTVELIHHDRLSAAKQLLINSDNIYIYSSGTALNQAESFKEKMMKIGRKVIISTNLNYQLYEASCMEKNNLAIIISYSGETENALKIADICSANENKILGITSIGENSLSKLCDAVLLISTKSSLFDNIADYSIHVSVNLLLDILYSLVFQNKFDQYYEHKEKYTKLLESQRTSTNSLLMKQ
ncbi:MAG TPA: MurR/RpiR family transcriptional regulator [Sporosarcina psychrophila]|uniref:MurR/RpiR family transcriptional regulator n=1 Tax=Sporosarcina psychrophila TaxID=1476 RepID=A0A921KEP3_SPOPS|nr:MurR/RpiR family transcriptional regulator [Sporosarcina psychrophila]